MLKDFRFINSYHAYCCCVHNDFPFKALENLHEPLLSQLLQKERQMNSPRRD
ncbi:Uncharacterized protein dnl_63460 [Desulfonema limicola]|uniref:Uncharacterized protein n=1 Tax=Desulfonema limicola TaxID=45656 RepID=A0A975GJS8_9BACT|nr:Uncharacterized protein dnl_63460 [Desulfonema limicola]